MQIKVCGLKYKENIAAVVSLQPDYIGFVFFRGSPRDVSTDATLASFARPIKQVQKVGVFVNAGREEILEAVAAFGLDLVQLHGSEPPGFCALLQQSIPVIKAFAMNENLDDAVWHSYRNCCRYFLFDSSAGGSGQSFDWRLLQDRDVPLSFFLSGGIGPDNMNKAMQLPNKTLMGIDVNSRLETAPGLKNIQSLQTLIHEIRTR